MTFNITLDWIIELLLTGLAISGAAFLLPFVYVRSFGYAVLVGVLIALSNQLIWWLLGELGVSFAASGGLAEAVINFFFYVLAIMLVDAILKGFRVSGFLMGAVFALVVAAIQYALGLVLATLF
jgi:putative membrane protein